MSDPERVEPDLLEEAMAPMAAADRWLAQARGRAEALAAQYPAPAQIESEKECRDARANRAAARKDAQAIDSERKALLREMEDALMGFKRDVRDLLAPLTDLDEGYKAAIDEWEERWRTGRLAALQVAYDDYAPALVPLVPLERIVARYGCEKGAGWLQRSTTERAAQARLLEAIDAIAEGERGIEEAVDPEDLEGAKADFFGTLDAGRAIMAAARRARQREEVRRLEQERAAVDTAPVATVEEAARIWEATTPGMPLPNGLRDEMAQAAGAPMPGEVPPYVMCCYGTQADADAFKAFCEGRGIRATVRPTGGRVHRIVPKG